MEIAIEQSKSKEEEEEKRESNGILLGGNEAEGIEGSSSSSNSTITTEETTTTATTSTTTTSGNMLDGYIDDDEDVCRICRNPGETDNPLRYPCACSGSIKLSIKIVYYSGLITAMLVNVRCVNILFPSLLFR